MELLNDHVILQRLRRYLALGTVVLVVSLASISLAFASRQQRNTLAGGGRLVIDSPVLNTQTIDDREWRVSQGELALINGTKAHLAADTLVITTQPGESFIYESAYWMVEPGQGLAASPELYFRFLSLDSTYRLRIVEGPLLTLEKISGGEVLQMAWVELSPSIEPPVVLKIVTQGNRIMVSLQDELCIDTIDVAPLPGDELGIKAGSDAVLWRVDQIRQLIPLD